MKRTIIWESDEIFIEDDKDMDDDEDEVSNDEAEITSEDGKKIRVKMPKSQQVVHTNFGQFLVNSTNNPYNSRNIYLAHTNFDITEEHIRALINVPGVEGFRILTRYSFSIVVGIAFEDEDVIESIENYFGVSSTEYTDEKTQEVLVDNKELVDNIIGKLKKKYWYVYIMPNGAAIIEEYDNEEMMYERTKFFIAISHLSEGLLLNSKDINE